MYKKCQKKVQYYCLIQSIETDSNMLKKLNNRIVKKKVEIINKFILGYKSNFIVKLDCTFLFNLIYNIYFLPTVTFGMTSTKTYYFTTVLRTIFTERKVQGIGDQPSFDDIADFDSYWTVR